jgi:hypothetical protein
MPLAVFGWTDTEMASEGTGECRGGLVAGAQSDLGHWIVEVKEVLGRSLETQPPNEGGARQLAEHVFPDVAVRQWVLSFPRPVRFLAARSRAVATRLLQVFTGVLFSWMRRSARRLGVAEPRTAGVTAIQRFGGAPNLNLHFHTLVADGVFDLRGSGLARFVSTPGPSPRELDALLERIVRRVVALLEKEEHGVELDELAQLQAAEVEQRARHPEPFEQSRHSAFLDGFSLHAGVRLHARDREGRLRLCRYLLRPPLALERLSPGEGDGLLYRMKRPRGNSLWLSLSPEQLLRKLASLVPPPRSHSVRYHGLFAPAARERHRVVPAPPCPDCDRRPGLEPHGPATLELHGPRGASAPAVTNREHEGLGAPSTRQPMRAEPGPSPTTTGAGSRALSRERYRLSWSSLLRRVFALDVLDCPRCHDRLRLIAFISQPDVAKKILDHLGFDSRGPPLSPAHSSAPELVDPMPDYGLADRTFQES